MAVKIVALLHILQYLVVISFHALALKFVVATLGAHFCRCGDKDFKFGIGKNNV